MFFFFSGPAMIMRKKYEAHWAKQIDIDLFIGIA